MVVPLTEINENSEEAGWFEGRWGVKLSFEHSLFYISVRHSNEDDK